VEGLWIWLVCAGIPLLFGLWAQMRVKSTFNRYSQGAGAVLRAAALTYVAGFVASLGQLIYFFLISRR
jgi:Zn-dependent membrane protease YugP